MVCSLLKAISAASFRRNPQTQCFQPLIRRFAKSIAPTANSLPPRPKLPNHALRHVFLKGSGPGGQKINKTSSAVQMTHLPTGIVVKSQATRSRSQNYKNARQILADKIELLEKGDESRVAKKKAMEVAKAKSREKKARRKYRAQVGAVEGQMDERDKSLGEPKEIREQLEPVSAVTNGGLTGKRDNMTT